MREIVKVQINSLGATHYEVTYRSGATLERCSSFKAGDHFFGIRPLVMVSKLETEMVPFNSHEGQIVRQWLDRL